MKIMLTFIVDVDEETLHQVSNIEQDCIHAAWHTVINMNACADQLVEGHYITDVTSMVSIIKEDA